MSAPAPRAPLATPDPGSSGAYPLTFRLAAELALSKEAGSGRSVSAGLAGGLGAFLLFFAVLLIVGRTAEGTALGVVLVVGALILFALLIRAGRSRTSVEESELVIDEQGIRFGVPGGRSVRVDWTDPSLKVDLRQFTGGRDEVLRHGDPRSTHPQWLSFFAPPRRSPRTETVVPLEAMAAVLRGAEEHGVTVRRVRVGFYWYHVARGPGFLAYEVEGDLQRAKSLNGVITRLRAPAWSSYPDE